MKFLSFFVLSLTVAWPVLASDAEDDGSSRRPSLPRSGADRAVSDGGDSDGSQGTQAVTTTDRSGRPDDSRAAPRSSSPSIDLTCMSPDALRALIDEAQRRLDMADSSAAGSVGDWDRPAASAGDAPAAGGCFPAPLPTGAQSAILQQLAQGAARARPAAAAELGGWTSGGGGGSGVPSQRGSSSASGAAAFCRGVSSSLSTGPDAEPFAFRPPAVPTVSSGAGGGGGGVPSQRFPDPSAAAGAGLFSFGTMLSSRQPAALFSFGPPPPAPPVSPVASVPSQRHQLLGCPSSSPAGAPAAAGGWTSGGGGGSSGGGVPSQRTLSSPAAPSTLDSLFGLFALSPTPAAATSGTLEPAHPAPAASLGAPVPAAPTPWPDSMLRSDASHLPQFGLCEPIVSIPSRVWVQRDGGWVYRNASGAVMRTFQRPRFPVTDMAIVRVECGSGISMDLPLTNAIGTLRWLSKISASLVDAPGTRFTIGGKAIKLAGEITQQPTPIAAVNKVFSGERRVQAPQLGLLIPLYLWLQSPRSTGAPVEGADAGVFHVAENDRVWYDTPNRRLYGWVKVDGGPSGGARVGPVSCDTLMTFFTALLQDRRFAVS